MVSFEVEVTFKLNGDVLTRAYRRTGESMSDVRGSIWATICLMYPSAIFIKWGYIKIIHPSE